MSAEGASNQTIAARTGVSAPTVSRWRGRYRRLGMAGLHGELRPGRLRPYGDEQVTAMINKVPKTKPKAATHWSVRPVMATTGISKREVARTFALFGLQPHRSKSFKLFTDPFFVEKARDIGGCISTPGQGAGALCRAEEPDSSPRTYATDASVGPGYVEGIAHDYKRYGTTTLFAALNVLDGSGITQCKPYLRHQEFLAFHRYLAQNIPPHLDALGPRRLAVRRF